MVRIAVTGPECSGKSQLAKWLADNLFDTRYLKEYAREYLGKKGEDYKYTQEDVLKIAQTNADNFNKAFRANNDALVVDTDFYVMDIWWEEHYGGHHPEIQEFKKVFDFDLYVLCEPDLPWEYDPLRENPNDRYRLFEKYKEAIHKDHHTLIVANGEGEERMTKVLTKILKRFPNLTINE